MSPTIRLLDDQLLVEPLGQPERFSNKRGLLWIPDNPERDKRSEFSHLGKVVAVGPGAKYIYGAVRADGSRPAYEPKDGGRFPMNVQIGDTVLYERRPWGEIDHEGKHYVILVEAQHIVGIVEKEEVAA